MKTILALSVCALLAGAPAAQAATIAAFDDPAVSSSTPLFFFNGETNQLSGGWGMLGLTLQTIAGDFDDVSFMMTPVGVDGVGEVDAGTINFFDSGENPIFEISFDSAHLTPTLFGATEFLATNEVVFTGDILPAPVEAESFSFAFANQTDFGAGGFTVTAAFTSSATIIPEPATLALMAFCVLGAARSRNRRAFRRRYVDEPVAPDDVS
jgi:hypothetical protein